MKKSLIALAVLAASSGAAMAQSSVTLFGIVDASVGRVSGSGAGNRVGLNSGGYNTSRIGFRGTEDLGGGLAASFWLEGQILADTGSQGTGDTGGSLFGRRSTVSLSGAFGEVRLGRDFTASFANQLAFDPFAATGFGSANLDNGLGRRTLAGATTGSEVLQSSTARASNQISYFLPNTLGGFYGQLQYGFGETISTANNDRYGDTYGARVGYANGPLNVGGAYQLRRGSAGNGAATGLGVALNSSSRDYEVGTIGATYDFGVVKPFVQVNIERAEAVAGLPRARLNSYLVGASAPLGAGELRASAIRYDLKDSGNDANKFAIGYNYNLSKRTAVYTNVATVRNKGASIQTISGGGLASTGVSAGGNSTGFEFGVRHAF
ncbi:MAG: porin [Xylophilus ampelinus]